MQRRLLLPSIGCLGASGLTLLACSVFGVGSGSLTQESKMSAAPRPVRATGSSNLDALSRDTDVPALEASLP